MKTICNHAADASNALDAQGRQDRTRQGIPASDASNAAGKQDYGKQDKTRWRKHSTLHLARRDPRLERVECHTLGMQFAIAWEALDPKVTSRMPQARIATNTLRESAQSKYTWTCARSTLCENLVVKWRGPLTLDLTVHKKHFMRELTGKMPQPRVVCASLQNRNARGHWSFQHFVPKFAKKCCKTRPETAPFASPHRRNALGHFARSAWSENLKEKCRRPRPGSALDASVRKNHWPWPTVAWDDIELSHDRVPLWRCKQVHRWYRSSIAKVEVAPRDGHRAVAGKFGLFTYVKRCTGIRGGMEKPLASANEPESRATVHCNWRCGRRIPNLLFNNHLPWLSCARTVRGLAWCWSPWFRLH